MQLQMGEMKMRVTIKAFIFAMMIAIIISPIYGSAHAANRFFDGEDKYRGFYWFEQKSEKQKTKEKSVDLTFESMSPEEARQNIKERKERLNQARNIMLELSFQGAPQEEIFKSVINYKKLENQMRDSGLELALAWEAVNFTNPEIVDRINNPVNVPANKLKRSEKRKEVEAMVKDFANQYDLVLFQQAGCPYCNQFKPILDYFVSTYGFNLDVVNSGKEHQKLLADLGIESAPTLIAISKDSKVAFELSRGLSTLSELEDNIMQAVSLIKSGYQFGVRS